ncbi:Transcriptional adapter ada2 [Savitreella phatthalungensis]
MTTIYEDASCDVCGTGLSSKTVRFSCAHDDCPDWDTCVTCFASGSVPPESAHKPWHPYRIIAPIERPLFVPDWSGDEELQLINASERYGLGNWADVADHIGNRRTKEECAAHYTEVYLRSSCYPLPALEVELPYDPQEFQARKRRRIADRAALQKLPPSIKQKPITSTPECHEVAGFMPGRNEFSYEYENDAEVSVKDMEFDQDLAEGNQDEVNMKLTLLDIYNSRLTRRADRKSVIFEHQLLDYKRNQVIDKKRAKEVRELLARSKPFARLQGRTEYELFSEGLIDEFHTRRRIAELQEWRRMGLTHLESGQKYEKDKQHRLFARSTGTNTPVLAGSRSTTAAVTSAAVGLSGSSSSGSSVPASRGGDLRKPVPGTITNSVDVQLLSREEQSLCSNLRLLPKAYLVVKETIVRELWRTSGALTKNKAKQLLQIDPIKTSKIYEYIANHFHLNG